MQQLQSSASRLYVLNNNNLLKSQAKKPIEYSLIPITENEFDFSLDLANKLRSEGKVVDVVLTDKKLGDKLTYAAKIAEKGIVIGENEVKNGDLKIKNFETGEISALSFLTV